MKWFPLINYTHYSLGRAYSKPSELVAKCKENDYVACGICDYKSISGAVDFFQECKDNDIKPIIGCSFDGFALFAKNKDGWFELVQIVSSIDKNGNVNRDILNKAGSSPNLLHIPLGNCHESYYVNKDDCRLHRIQLCSALKTTLPAISKLVGLDNDGTVRISDKMPAAQQPWAHFFVKDCYYVPNTKEVKTFAREGELHTLQHVLESCEDYNILSKPILPKFDCPDGQSEEEYLKSLCRDGWQRLLIDEGKVSTPEAKQTYLERFTEELQVIKDANLFGYFLIVQDILAFVRSKGWMAGPGRGSSGGCLISYLIGITQVDPVEFDLLFARFYNAGRNTADRVSLPDIDIDVPAGHRDEVIAYLKDKYGHERVSQMITLGRLRGKSAIKEVFRVHEACSFAEINVITKFIPDEAKISDQLADMDEEDKSIIRWALIHNSKELQDFCTIDDEGILHGDYASFFEDAIKIEGTFKSQGKHAAGVVISASDLSKVCPMVNTRDGDEKAAGLEMSALEAMGQVKLDVLGLTLLDKLMFIDNLCV